ncbi:MAG: glycosyltransferase family 4 protein [Solirubrobacteraceae bacterium]
MRSRLISSLEWHTLPLVQPLQLIRRPEDVALAVLEREGLTHALLKRAGVPPWSRVPLVVVSCWLADELRTASPIRRALLRQLAQSVDLFVFWSRNQLAIFRDQLGVDEDRLFFVPFGIETDFYVPSEAPRESFVLSVGRDRGRDYPTLLAAAGQLDIPVKIVCPMDAVQGLAVAANVELIGEVDHFQLRRLLGEASVVALASDPDVAYPTGQTVLLDAMAVGTPTVLTGSAAMRDYVRHGENAWVVPPRDPDALRDGILAVLSDDALARRISANALQDVRERFNVAEMWRAVAERLRVLVALDRA